MRRYTKARFTDSQADQCQAVKLTSEFLGIKLDHTPINLPSDGENQAAWDEHGLVRSGTAGDTDEVTGWCGRIAIGNFETAGLNLEGILRKQHTDLDEYGLVSGVWNLIWLFLGRRFFNFVVFNVKCFSGDHNAGSSMYGGVPEKMIKVMEALTVEGANACGTPEGDVGASSFGCPVRLLNSTRTRRPHPIRSVCNGDPQIASFRTLFLCAPP